MSASNRWHLDEEMKLLEDDNRCRAFEKAEKDGYDCLEELHTNYAKYVYANTGVKIDASEAEWDCNTFFWHSDMKCDVFR